MFRQRNHNQRYISGLGHGNLLCEIHSSWIGINALCEDEVDEDDDVDRTSKSHIDKHKFRNGGTDSESTAWLLAIFLALRHFLHFVDGSNVVTAKTDHKPIIHALSKTSDAWTGRQQRQLSEIAETGFTVQHLYGKLNPVVDAL